MNEYTLTGDQLGRLLETAIAIYAERIHSHGMSTDMAQATAIQEILDGLDDETPLTTHPKVWRR